MIEKAVAVGQNPDSCQGFPWCARHGAWCGSTVWPEWYPADALEVRPVCGPWGWEPLAEQQGRRREAGAEGSCKQSAGLTNRKRISGVRIRARGPQDPKPDITQRVRA
ncbi:hypothetical protein ASD85_25040 [Rhizobium sp. Root651]|nr:hypothetical protein ASD85_25040 [Rhizobium sp. Root651]